MDSLGRASQSEATGRPPSGSRRQTALGSGVTPGRVDLSLGHPKAKATDRTLPGLALKL